MLLGHGLAATRAELILLLGLLLTTSVFTSRPSATTWSNGSVEHQRRMNDNDDEATDFEEGSPRAPTGMEACDTDTGGGCLTGSCHTSRGVAVGCVDSKCICNEGFCASFGTCLEPNEMCDRDTTGECKIMGCSKDRGKTQCILHKCICDVGYCAKAGKCVENKNKDISPEEKEAEKTEEKAEEKAEKEEESSMCFGRRTSWTISSQSKAGPWMVTQLDGLRTGDYVLSAMNPNGEVFVDRVWKNLHLHEISALHEMVEIRHELGSLVVSPSHIVFVNGIPRPAHAVRPGSVLHASGANFDVAGGQGRAGGHGAHWDVGPGTEIVVLQVNRVLDTLINPVTHSGRLLVGARELARPSRVLENSEVDAYLREMVLSTTVIESRWDTLLAVAELPRLGKLFSYALPDALHNSKLAEDAILGSVMVVGSLPLPFAIILTAIVDTVGTILFVTYHSAAIALTCSTSPLLSVMLLSFIAATSFVITVVSKRRGEVATPERCPVDG